MIVKNKLERKANEQLFKANYPNVRLDPYHDDQRK